MSVESVVGTVAGIWLMITVFGALPMLMLRFANFRYTDQRSHVIEQAMDAIGEEWLNAAKFQPEGVVRPMGIPMALFKHAQEHTALAVYFVGGNILTDFVTTFPGHVGLTTSSTIDGVTAPSAPGSSVQCLPSFSHEDRWRAHIVGAKLLSDELNVKPQPMGPVDEAMEASQHRQIGNLLRRPWLLLSLPYRYFVVRLRYRNVTFESQFERGWINVESLRQLVQDESF